MTHIAKKSFGQNFLKSQAALFKMCEAGNVTDQDIILEIGPGKGALTTKLLEKAQKVIAIEKDRDLMELLHEKFEEFVKKGQLVLVNDDILSVNTENLGLKEGKYKIIANIPYNITGSIIRRFLSEVEKPSQMTLLVQKEVAERIVARDNKESILSLSIKAFGTPKYIMKVSKKYFSPSPKVDSAIIAINDISKSYFHDKNEEYSFFKLIKAGFAHKRKVLRKNLDEFIKDIDKIDNIFKELQIDSKTRAEDLNFLKWIAINEKIIK